MDALINAIFILLGWMLGLLSPRIVDLMQRPYRRSELKRSLFLELEDFRVRLASAIYVFASSRGSVDRELLLFIEPILRSDKVYPQSKEIADAVGLMLKLTDNEIGAISLRGASKTGGLTIKKYSLPFLNSQLSSLYLFSPEFQRISLKIASRLEIINDEIDTAMFNYKKTFDSLSTENYAIVLQNYNYSSHQIAIQYRALIADINNLFAMKG
jgi:hypothetical protein